MFHRGLTAIRMSGGRTSKVSPLFANGLLRIGDPHYYKKSRPFRPKKIIKMLKLLRARPCVGTPRVPPQQNTGFQDEEHEDNGVLHIAEKVFCRKCIILEDFQISRDIHFHLRILLCGTLFPFPVLLPIAAGVPAFVPFAKLTAFARSPIVFLTSAISS
ncbi:hypothetical protein CVS40_8587 [Lucilia cuprina]|nr:hypothetical protein CVS40_8587 [Lucilia cuprina]